MGDEGNSNEMQPPDEAKIKLHSMVLLATQAVALVLLVAVGIGHLSSDSKPYGAHYAVAVLGALSAAVTFALSVYTLRNRDAGYARVISLFNFLVLIVFVVVVFLFFANLVCGCLFDGVADWTFAWLFVASVPGPVHWWNARELSYAYNPALKPVKWVDPNDQPSTAANSLPQY